MIDDFAIGTLVGAIYMAAIVFGVLVMAWFRDHRIGIVIEDRE